MRSKTHVKETTTDQQTLREGIAFPQAGTVVLPLGELDRLRDIEKSFNEGKIEITEDAMGGYWYPWSSGYGASNATRRVSTLSKDDAIQKLTKLNDENIKVMRNLKSILDANPTYRYSTGFKARLRFLFKGTLIKDVML